MVLVIFEELLELKILLITCKELEAKLSNFYKNYYYCIDYACKLILLAIIAYYYIY